MSRSHISYNMLPERCTVPGCKQFYFAKGMCRDHYQYKAYLEKKVKCQSHSQPTDGT